MLKRILLLLDETQSAGIARHYAFQLAREMNAEIVGLAGVDLAYIEAPMLGGLGTAAYKARLEETLTAQAKATRRRLHEAFARDCETHCVGLNWLSFDGDPLESLYLATENSDLLVTGHDIAFHGAVHESSSEVLAKLLRVSPRPIVVCGNAPPPGRDIMIAYDGSVPVMRALQLFVLLGMGRDGCVHVASIDENEELAVRRTAGAIDFLHRHDYRTEAHPLASSVHPADALRVQAADRKIGTLVMGAYGHRGFREFLFGSTTRSLVDDPPCPVFVYP